MYSVGLILYEIYRPFTTESERYRCLYDVRGGHIDDDFIHEWPLEVLYLCVCVCVCLHTVSDRYLTAIFPGEPGLAGCPLILLLHLFLDCASFWDRPEISMSFLTQSHRVFFGRPLGLDVKRN